MDCVMKLSGHIDVDSLDKSSGDDDDDRSKTQCTLCGFWHLAREPCIGCHARRNGGVPTAATAPHPVIVVVEDSDVGSAAAPSAIATDNNSKVGIAATPSAHQKSTIKVTNPVTPIDDDSATAPLSARDLRKKKRDANKKAQEEKEAKEKESHVKNLWRK